MERWLKLLQEIPQNGYMTNQKLSEKLGVSKRTIYNDITALNEELSDRGAQIVTKSHYGVSLNVTDPEKYRLFLLSLQQDSMTAGDNSEARARLIVQRLISSSEPIKLDDLGEELFISRSTLKNDLKKVRSILDKYDLKIEYSPYKGSWITGTENNMRRCLTDMEKMLINDSGKSLNEDMKIISETIKKVFRKYSFRMPEFGFNNLVVHIYIAIMRIRMGYLVENAEGYEEYTNDRDEAITTDIIESLESVFHLKFPKNELGYIMLHLECKKISTNMDNSVVTADIYEIVTDMLDEIDNMFHYNFKYDFELISMLSMHLVSLKVRILYDMTLENPLIEEIRQGALLAYEMASVACSKLEKKYNKKVTSDETAYIALHFSLAIERYKNKHKKNVLIVCGTGRGSAELLAYRVRQEYDSYLNVKGTHESTDFTGVNFEEYDYILTTVHIEEKVPIPVIEINSISSIEGRKKVGHYLSSGMKSDLLQFFSEDRFLPHMKGQTKEDVLQQLCGLAVVNKEAPEQFLEQVLQRESLGNTSFGNKIAIPHPYRPQGEKSFVVTGILDEPILWNGEPVQIVFLLSMKENGDQNLQLFYRSVGKLLSEKGYVEELIQHPEFDTLITILDSLSGE